MAKRNRFPGARWCDDAWNEAIDGLRETLRCHAQTPGRPNPFARPLPCPITNPRRTAKILRIF